MPASINVICFECMTSSQYPSDAAGTKVTCPNLDCGLSFVVPAQNDDRAVGAVAKKARVNSPAASLKRTRLFMLIGFMVIAGIAVVSVSVHQKVYDRGQRDDNAKNLCQIYIALEGLAGSYGPGGIDDIRDKNGKPLLSWRVKALPFIEQSNIYAQFHTDEPWDSPHNLTLLDSMPKTYLDKANPTGPKNMTRCQLIRGPGTLFDGSKSDPFAKGAIPDGRASTIMLVHAESLVPWTKPEDIEYSADSPLPAFSKTNRDGFLAVFADGTVRSIPHDTAESKIRALISPRGGEQVSMSEFKVNLAAEEMKKFVDDVSNGKEAIIPRR
jgi:hypothetical protein